MLNENQKLILIIDDSEDNLQLLKILCEAKGYRVYCALNGREALSLLCELSVLPDLILLDAQMPIMDGYHFRIEQQKSERLKQIPVVIMTGETGNSIGKDMLNPQGVICKPISLTALADCMSPYI